MLLLCLLTSLLWAAAVATSERQCVTMSKSHSPLCQQVGYASVWMPNTLGHGDLRRAAREMSRFWPLVKTDCSASLESLLCLLYMPPCRASDTELQLPCRQLCEDARRGCEPLMRQYNIRWPNTLSCDTLPEAGGELQCYNSTTDGPISARGLLAAPDMLQMEADTSAAVASETTELQPAALSQASRLIVGFLSNSERLQQLQADTLQLQQQKLQLEIQLLSHQLAHT